MREIVLAPSFERAYRRYTRRDPALRTKIDSIIYELALDLSSPRLGVHKLAGKFASLWSCSCGYDCRIIFSIERDESSGQDRLVFIDIGTHDEVY